MSEENKIVYDESKIQTLSSLDHIRLRPGMYIGKMGDGSHPDDGIYILVKEIVDNSIDEFIMGSGRRIDIKVEGAQVTVRDYGRGIPLGKLVDCVSIINTGGKYNSDVFQFSVGLNGVGTKAVNALSSEFIVRSVRDGKFSEAKFEYGKVVDEKKGKCDEKNGTVVKFVPDHDLFLNYKFRMEYLEKRMWMYAYLNSGLSLYLNDMRYYSKNGLKDLIEVEVEDDKLYEIIAFKGKTIEFALCHTDNYGENYFSFVNGQYTNDGGTHLSAFREGVLKAINEFTGKTYQAADVRDGIVGAISIKLKDPIFESQTKNKLGNTDVRGPIVNAVRTNMVDYLHRNLEEAEFVIDKVVRNEKVRRQIQAVKKQSKEKAKKMTLKIPKLKDCKYHLGDRSGKGEQTMIFLTEGQSAAGSMVSCRDVYAQAIFSLKGKPLNCHNEKIDKVYKNDELYYIMQALNIEEDIENLRYNKVIIATDSDIDGLHIRNLLITFFLTYFEQLVLSGHVYILETPLFRVRNKKETIYCYNEKERSEAVQKIGQKGLEITRFKGLGEISPDEFGAFIGEDIRLQNVSVDHMRNVSEMLEFYMGKNTPIRREHIMNNLV
ncbi:MAG: type IIA DNA topoisomerase subunit B [Lentisphaerae bacterium]|nr:type IIA DNA topoisomerase subunit B [Lentisphaerota bacterium]MCP4102309.1 type IIA DNA topoisomerase subunit B [Lentisphaerota bacterium]